MSGATLPAGFEHLHRAVHEDEGQLSRRLGIEFLEYSPQRLVATMPVDGNRQPAGLLHGGASVALAETLGSIGAALHAGPDRFVVGVDINATHHRAAVSGLVTGTATPLHLGRTVATYEIVITDDKDRRVCTARITCLIRDPQA
jgi:1,4-dihydroxy-2-naphthoyl-CoA hydrolase